MTRRLLAVLAASLLLLLSGCVTSYGNWDPFASRPPRRAAPARDPFTAFYAAKADLEAGAATPQQYGVVQAAPVDPCSGQTVTQVIRLPDQTYRTVYVQRVIWDRVLQRYIVVRDSEAPCIVEQWAEQPCDETVPRPPPSAPYRR